MLLMVAQVCKRLLSPKALNQLGVGLLRVVRPWNLFIYLLECQKLNLILLKAVTILRQYMFLRIKWISIKNVFHYISIGLS